MKLGKMGKKALRKVTSFNYLVWVSNVLSMFTMVKKNRCNSLNYSDINALSVVRRGNESFNLL